MPAAGTGHVPTHAASACIYLVICRHASMALLAVGLVCMVLLHGWRMLLLKILMHSTLRQQSCACCLSPFTSRQTEEMRALLRRR
jgi:hypothetical protein